MAAVSELLALEQKAHPLPRAVRVMGRWAPLARIVLPVFHTIVVDIGAGEDRDDIPLLTPLSREEYCAGVLRAFLSDNPPPEETIFSTIPEAELLAYAAAHGVAIAPAPHDPARDMLDAIAKAQPQTYSSMRRSAERLRPGLERLRGTGRK